MPIATDYKSITTDYKPITTDHTLVLIATDYKSITTDYKPITTDHTLVLIATNYKPIATDYKSIMTDHKPIITWGISNIRVKRYGLGVIFFFITVPFYKSVSSWGLKSNGTKTYAKECYPTFFSSLLPQSCKIHERCPSLDAMSLELEIL